MNNQEIQQAILQVFKANTLSVISTVGTTNAPESAVVSFLELDTLDIVFATSGETRKYANLKTNKHVAFVIGWGTDGQSVQYEGTARELSTEESRPYIERMIAKNPHVAKFLNKPEERFFIVTPTWMRYMNLAAGKFGEI